jgi:membrane protein
MNKVISFSKKIILEMKEDRTTELAAEQAYYYMLSIFPMLILLLSIVPYLSIETKEAIDILQSVMPGETATIFKENVVQFISKPSGGNNRAYAMAFPNWLNSCYRRRNKCSIP